MQEEDIGENMLILYFGLLFEFGSTSNILRSLIFIGTTILFSYFPFSLILEIELEFELFSAF